MSYQPVSGIVPQYSTDDNELANGYYLKFYQANTTTPLSMATDSSGATLLVKCKLSSAGFPISNPLDNSTVFIPHVNANYRLVIYPTEADANANNTASALVNIPDVEPLVGNTVTTSTGTQTVATALDNRLVSQTAEDVAGTAALVDTGTAAGEVPLNSSLVPKSGGTFTGNITAPGITATDSFTSPGIDDNATSNAITIDSSENVGIGTTTPAEKLDVDGSIRASTIRASTGILFGTDTAAANTLDDYEEGTWTPASTELGTLTILKANYTKIGDTVRLFAQVTASSTTTVTLDNAVSISGIPISVDSGNTLGVGGSIQYYANHGNNKNALGDLITLGDNFDSEIIVVRGTFTYADCASITISLTYKAA